MATIKQLEVAYRETIPRSLSSKLEPLIRRLETLEQLAACYSNTSDASSADVACGVSEERKGAADRLIRWFNQARSYHHAHADCPSVPRIPEVLALRGEKVAASALAAWCQAVDQMHPLVAIEQRKAEQAAPEFEPIGSAALEARTGWSRTTRKNRIAEGLLGFRQAKARGSHEYAWLIHEQRAMTRDEFAAWVGSHGVNEGQRRSTTDKAI